MEDQTFKDVFVGNDRLTRLARLTNNIPGNTQSGGSSVPVLKSSRDESSSKKQKLWVTIGSVFNIVNSEGLRHMPLSLDNRLPVAVIRFGTSGTNEVPFSCHIDSCVAMNTANLLLH